MELTTIYLAATDTENELATKHVQDKYFKQFGTRPNKADVYVIARTGTQITGTVGIDFPDTEGLLPIQRIYAQHATDIPVTLNVQNSVQFGRWTSEDPIISISLVYAASKYARSLGKEYVWLEQTETTNRILTMHGMLFSKLHNNLRIEQNIPPCDRNFYLTHCPECYLMTTTHTISVLEKKIHTYISKDLIVLSPSFL